MGLRPTLAAVRHAVGMPPSRRLAPWLALVALILTGCAAEPGTVDPSGVDGLEIPTPAPDPADFESGIDNPYLPLRPGTEWVYESTGEQPATITVSVSDETTEVDGVSTTVVREVVSDADGEVIEETSGWYAQDRAGNVWLFGEDGSWEAGIDGAQAGLAMPATPRVGDGYEQGAAPGTAEDRARVLALGEEERETEAGLFEDLLVVEQTTPLEPGLVERTYYARGTGLVSLETLSGGADQLELVSFTRPD